MQDPRDSCRCVGILDSGQIGRKELIGRLYPHANQKPDPRTPDRAETRLIKETMKGGIQKVGRKLSVYLPELTEAGASNHFE